MNNKRVIRTAVVLLVVALIVALEYVVGPALFDALLAMHGL